MSFSCYDGVTDAVFRAGEGRCVGWTRGRYSNREYRDLKTCMCIICPGMSDEKCAPGNEC